MASTLLTRLAEHSKSKQILHASAWPSLLRPT